MPIYEYQCEKCSQVCEFLEKNMKTRDKHKCPHCGSSKLKKLFSSFAAGKTDQPASGASSCPTGTCPFS